jgi:hypothetical protein
MMRPTMALGLFLLGLSGCMPPGLGSPDPSTVPADMVPDPDYRPNVGDRSVLYGVQGGSPMPAIPLLKDMTAFDVFQRYSQEQNSGELAEMESRGNLTWTPLGTRVAVLKTRSGSRAAAEVKPLDGPRKDQSVWVPLEYVARLRPAPKPQ